MSTEILTIYDYDIRQLDLLWLSIPGSHMTDMLGPVQFVDGYSTEAHPRHIAENLFAQFGPPMVLSERDTRRVIVTKVGMAKKH